jgi:hypothetical protein
MLLSEAIRLGAMLGPQLTNSDMVKGSSMASCALGSAALATGCVVGTNQSHTNDKLMEVFPWLSRDIIFSIWSKNDTEKMSREQIADWLVESGNDCESVTTAPSEQIAAALVSEMVTK